MSDKLLPDLGTAWSLIYAPSDEFVFDCLSLSMVAKAGQGEYTSSLTIHLSPPHLVSFEFDDERFDELLRFLPADGAGYMRQKLGKRARAPVAVNLPERALVVGIRAKFGTARENPDERYVPLVVTSWFAPGLVMSVRVVKLTRGPVTGSLEIADGPKGPRHEVAGYPISDGDRIEVWLRPDNAWVEGTYLSTTSAGVFENRFAALVTENMGTRPFFLGAKVRLIPRG
jgi:hypothetical protein